MPLCSLRITGCILEAPECVQCDQGNPRSLETRTVSHPQPWPITKKGSRGFLSTTWEMCLPPNPPNLDFSQFLMKVTGSHWRFWCALYPPGIERWVSHMRSECSAAESHPSALLGMEEPLTIHGAWHLPGPAPGTLIACLTGPPALPLLPQALLAREE